MRGKLPHLPPAYVHTSFVSHSLDRRMKLLVRWPAAGRAAPALYLLHGAGRDELTYLLLAGLSAAPKDLLDAFWIVMPEGNRGWYLDSPKEPSSCYESYLLELMAWVERRWPVRRDRAGRAIGGFSMGGFGAIRLAARYPERFCAASSIIGPLDIMHWFPDYYGIAKLLGTGQSAWQAENPCDLAAGLLGVALWLCTGSEAFDRPQNESFVRRLSALSIPHTFTTLPGEHDLDLVSRSVLAQLAFHNDVFTGGSGRPVNREGLPVS
jgi:S-formylglutathione hydrolase FrmB